MVQPPTKILSPDVDPLIGLREFISASQKSFDPDFAPLFFKAPVCILDSSYVISDLRRHVRTGKDTVLLDCLKNGVIKAIAPELLAEEVQSKLDEISQDTRVELDHVAGEWRNHYRAYISFIKATDERISNLLQQLRDANDRDFIRAFESTKADHVLADDPDIRVLGISPTDPVRFLIDLRHHARGQALQMTMVFGGGLITATVVGSAIGLFKIVTKLIQSINSKLPWFFPTLFITLCAVALHPQGREFLQKQLSKISLLIKEVLEKGKRRSVQVKEAFVEQYGDTLLNANSARKRLAESPKRDPSLNKVSDYVARALAECFEPLNVSQLAKYVQKLGYEPRGPHFIVYLRKVLRADPRFNRLPSGQWTLS
jgi:hypothetical protein